MNDDEINKIAGNCWYYDEDLLIFDYKKFARLLQEKLFRPCKTPCGDENCLNHCRISNL
jgi:hypothetical protein